MRGHGRSGKPDSIEGYSSRLYADDFMAVLDAFNVKRPVVIGWCAFRRLLNVWISETH